jgi:predicted kinase
MGEHRSTLEADDAAQPKGPHVPKLILLNGPGGCGKSTLASRYADEFAPALNLDIDRVRDLIGGWRDDPFAGGLLARAIALAAARTHLSAGHDVIIPQLVARPQFPEQLEELARDMNVAFHEIVLMDSRENAIHRFTERNRLMPGHRHVRAEELAATYDRLIAFLATRPNARIIATEYGRPDAAYRSLLATLSAPLPDIDAITS